VIQRFIKKIVVNSLFKQKVIIVYGPRQAGKTTLVKDILQDFQTEKSVKYFSCDDRLVREALAAENYAELQRNIGTYDLIVLDEAQRVVNIGLKLKLLIDNNPAMQIIATGSASFDLANKVAEPLTGRFYKFDLLPLSTLEIVSPNAGGVEGEQELNHSMIYGNYPDIYKRAREDAITLLATLSSSYLYKDILELENIKKPEVLEKIVTLLALQIGNEVNLSEIARVVGLNVRTVDSYINLLEKAYVIFRLRAYATNKRNEVSRNFKVYFYDLGIRNSIINNFNPLESRNDVGGLFGNWCLLERLKSIYNGVGQRPNRYFWRTYTQKEVDYIEEIGGKIRAYEFKFTKDGIQKYTIIKKELGVAEVNVINRKNVLDFLRIE
jgi:predicted AAA+ superfamily ATPase